MAEWRCPGRATVILVLTLPGSTAGTAQEGPIQDNSFLVEEAYNQEAGVVQHIAGAQRDGDAWVLAFTEEWPLGGLRHQAGFTLQFEAPAGTAGGLGDTWLNYRYQILGSGTTTVALAPRLSLAFPTGDPDAGRGTGGIGVQTNVPLSVVLSRTFVAHLNAGATIFPSARGPGGSATTLDPHAGAGLFWLVRPAVNLLLETLWTSESSVLGPGRTSREDAVYISPGIRAAFMAGGVQVVPGIGVPIGLGPRSGHDQVFLYLSLEHAFR